METLGRWAAYLAIAGGALFVVSLIPYAFSPTLAAAVVGVFVGIVLIGAAVPGLYWRTRAATGRLGLVSAWLSGLGTIAIVPLAAYLIATNDPMLTQPNAPPTPAGVITFLAVFAWLVGNLGFAVAVIRARILSRLGAWLVITGAVVAVATTPLYGVTDPTVIAAITLLFGLMPVGWIVVGYAAWRQAST